MTELRPWAELCERLAGTTKKLEKRAWMAEYLRELPVADAALAALYLAGTPFPETDQRQLSVGGASLWRVVKELTQANDAVMHDAYRRHGDMGAAAFDLLAMKGAAEHATLTIEDAADSFSQLAAAKGTSPRQALLRSLLERATPLEAKYLIKLMSGDMRTGVKQAQVEEAIAVATERELTAVRRAVMLLGDLSEVVRLSAADRLSEARMRLFHPLGFMLASPVDSVEEAMARFAEEVRAEQKGEGGAKPIPETEGTSDGGAASEMQVPSTGLGRALRSDQNDSNVERALVEARVQPALMQAHIQDKFDGIRCQLHCGDPWQPGRVALFSRSRDDMTHSFPELTEAFANVSEPLILDGEILAWNTDPAATEQRALPFKSLQNRIGRKRVTAAMREQTPVVFMAFDLLYRGKHGSDDALLLEQPLAVRRAMLEEVYAAQAPHTVVSSTPVEAESSRNQGTLFAAAGAVTQPAENGFARLVLADVARLSSAEQLEQAYVDARARGNEGVMLKAAASVYQPGRRGLAWLKLKRELATLDVVVTAAEYGHGKRAGTLSDYTFAVRDGETLKNVGKAYSGLTDAEIARLSQYFHEHTLEDFGGWRTVEPTIVLEVAFNNLMRSDRHASGFAMRFPRIMRIRDDKPVEEIDTLARVEELYNRQPDRPVETSNERI
ncbi:MAG TPA: ATP-dependent DNA ligase [Acidobacteriaceae bacterium]|jgi:DNA ligase-1|nr:ATP-dependent DNA ligase [Acidobacteriaceae bacterium]